jgi:NAD+ synthase
MSCGAHDALVYKTPTADLEGLAPLKPDETAFGVSYDEIDDFLEGKRISDTAYEVILNQYRSTMHKRSLPADPLTQS